MPIKIVILVLALLSVPSHAGVSKTDEQFRHAGDWLEVGIPLLAMGSSLFLSRHQLPAGESAQGEYKLAPHPALELTYSLAFTAILTEALKKATQEPRPNGTGLSFPSGHTSISFAGAEFLRQHWGWSWGIPAYVAASVVGYSRVVSRRHYTHDVIVGAALGIASNHLHPWKTGHRGWLQLTPRIDTTNMRQIGLGLELRW